MTKLVLVAGAALFAAGLGAAAAPLAADPPPAGPYAGMQQRAIKAMAPERVADILAGRGAGYALSAELNGYPGPRHVIDLAGELALAPEQLRRAGKLFADMEGEARPLGAALVALEAELEAMFRSGDIDEARLNAKTAEIGASEARLRAAHLKYHLAMAQVLSPRQRAEYDRLRGYVGTGGSQGGSHGGGHGGGHGGHGGDSGGQEEGDK